MTDLPFSRTRIFDDSIEILQRTDGYRFSEDALLLSWYIHESCKKNSSLKCIEIGAGSGVISITLLKRGLQATIESIEIQRTLFELLSTNITDNNLQSDLIPVFDNFITMSSFLRTSYDCIFCNPPYFSVDSGRMNPDSEKAAARHECFGTLSEFLSKASSLLKKKGLFFFIYPVSRLQSALHHASRAGLYCTDICFVKERPSCQPSLFLATLTKGREGTALSSIRTLTIKNEQSTYTREAYPIFFSS